MRLRLSPDALRDLDEIEDDTVDRWGEVQAERYTAARRAAAERLVDNPALGKLRRGLPPD